METELVAYTDGACTGGRYGGWAAEVAGEMISGQYDPTTNNAMEMFAILQALEHCPSYSDVLIVTDSKLCLGWLCRNWKCEKNPVIASMIPVIKETIWGRKLNVRFQLVKGHSTTAGNNRADKVAALEAQRCRNDGIKKALPQ